MKKFLPTLLLLPYMAWGQTADRDSTSILELGEVTIVADRQRADATKTVYIPDNRQRAAAADGTSLLARMNIPQLNVNPVSGDIKTADGQNVSIFINYHAASQEDVAGLNTADVKRVEFLNFPTDPRFLRAQYVVNFITRGQTYGGYTKINDKERIFVNSGEASLYSKFSYKSMEFDIMAVGEYDNNPHIGEQSSELYRSDSKTIYRLTDTQTGKHRERGLFAGLRASWNKNERFSLRNLISINAQNIPVNTTSGTVEFSSLYPRDDFATSSHTSNLNYGWNGEIFAAMGRGWSLNGSVNAVYAINKTGSEYTTGLTDIINNANEHGWSLREDAQINKTRSDRFTLFAGIISGAGNTKINYSGTDESVNRFRQTFFATSVGASMKTDNIYGSIDIGYATESNTINGQSMNDRYPFTHLSLQYAPNSKNSFSLWAQYATFSPDASMKNPNTIQQNELMYISGNPDLECSRHIATNISYTFLPDNRWQLSAYASFFKIADRQAPIYSPHDPDGGILKKYQNDGDYNHGQIGARLTGKFLDGKLVATIAPRLLLYHTTGSNSISHYPLTGGANADYYLNNFNFGIFWNSGWSYVDGDTCFLRKFPSEYSFEAGWSDHGWNIRLSLINIFRTSWNMSNDRLDTRWYGCTTTQFGSTGHRRISIAVTYTFSYGRRISQNNELQNTASGSSSILR